MWGWVIGAVVVAVAGIAWSQHRAGAGVYRPMSSRQPARPDRANRPLGTEALDLDAVRRTQRRNESLERAHTSWTGRRGKLTGTESADTDIEPLADDETYARRYHAAFQRNKDKL